MRYSFSLFVTLFFSKFLFSSLSSIEKWISFFITSNFKIDETFRETARRRKHNIAKIFITTQKKCCIFFLPFRQKSIFKHGGNYFYYFIWIFFFIYFLRINYESKAEKIEKKTRKRRRKISLDLKHVCAFPGILRSHA